MEAHISLKVFGKIPVIKKNTGSFLFINNLCLVEFMVVNREASWEAAVNDHCNLIFKIYHSRSCTQK